MRECMWGTQKARQALMLEAEDLVVATPTKDRNTQTNVTLQKLLLLTMENSHTLRGTSSKR